MQATSGQEISLHFYPNNNVLHVMQGGISIASFPAKGGDPQGNPAHGYESTTRGTFTIYGWWQHEKSGQCREAG